MTDYTRAACRAIPAAERDDIFFPRAGNNANRAKAICRACPIRTACLRDALEVEGDGISERGRYGIYGATTPDERALMMRRARA